MPEQPRSKAEPVELTKRLRGAIKQDQLNNVLEAAGARNIEGNATEVLGETTAAHLGPLFAQGRFEAPSQGREPEQKLVQAAKGAFDTEQLAQAFQEAGIDEEQGTPIAARELARIAQRSTEFARAEDRPVCHNCTAIGAARAAADFGHQPATQ